MEAESPPMLVTAELEDMTAEESTNWMSPSEEPPSRRNMFSKGDPNDDDNDVLLARIAIGDARGGDLPRFDSPSAYLVEM